MTPARKWTQPAGRAPVRAASDPSHDQLLRALDERERRGEASSRLLDVVREVPHRDGMAVWRALVQLERLGLTRRVPTEGLQWHWRLTLRGVLRVQEIAALAREKRNPAECESAGQVKQDQPREEQVSVGEKVQQPADACQQDEREA